jgi:hypothetical protein
MEQWWGAQVMSFTAFPASGPAVCGANAPAARPAVGPGVCPARSEGFPAVLRAGRPANNSPSNGHRASLPSPSSELKQICWTALRAATFQPFRSSAALTGRRPALPQGLGTHRSLRRDNPCMRVPSGTQRADAGHLFEHPGDAGAPVGRPGGSPCAQPRSAGAGRSRRAAASPKSCLSSELEPSPPARSCSRASYLGAFQPRAPQGTRSAAAGKQSGRRPACPLGRALSWSASNTPVHEMIRREERRSRALEN